MATTILEHSVDRDTSAVGRLPSGLAHAAGSLAVAEHVSADGVHEAGEQAPRLPFVALDRDTFRQYVDESLNEYDEVAAFPALKLSEVQMLAEGAVRMVNLALAKNLDTLFFLDKSARPLGYLFRQTWDRLYPPDQYPDSKCPDIKYINIGKKLHIPEVIPGEIVTDIGDRFTDLAGKRIGVVDEHSETGNTLVEAKRAMAQFFPHAQAIYYTNMLTGPPDTWSSSWEKTGVVEDRQLEIAAMRRNGLEGRALDEEVDRVIDLISADQLFAKAYVRSPHGVNIRAQQNDLRHSLASLAKVVAQHCTKTTDRSAVETEPFISASASAIQDLSEPLNPGKI